jgi:hypothetical protein
LSGIEDVMNDPSRPASPPEPTHAPIAAAPISRHAPAVATQPQTPPPLPLPADAPITSSITSWNRIEPRCRDAQMTTSTSARVFDPLWFITRQWQIGEFQAEDAGSPVMARVRATNAPLSRCHLGDLPPNTRTQAPAYDPRGAPLEALVERRRMRAVDASDPRMLSSAVEAGLHFLRMLESQPLSKDYRAALITKFALQAAPTEASDSVDESTARFARFMLGRAPDARRMAAAFRDANALAQLLLDPGLAIAPGDRAEVQLTALAWLAWYDALFSEPSTAADDAWDGQRIEYALTVSARVSAQPTDEVTLSVSEFDDGRLEWHAFDLNAEVNMGTDADRLFTTLTETTVPAPVTFRGSPAPRFWEMEDALIAYGLVPVGPTDLAQLMMIEYASGYGNDWFVVPLTLPVGSVTSVNSLVVTDSFGVRTLLRPIGDRALAAANWSMWQHAYLRRAGTDAVARPASNLFFMPPASGRVIDATPLEDVLMMRDEMANIAWAIERSIESPIEQAIRRDALGAASADTPLPAATPDDPNAPPLYLLASTVPPNWIPLLPVQLTDPVSGRIVSRLRRGAVRQSDGSPKIHPALGQVLNAAQPLLLYDEEVPREGVHVTVRRRLARWIDGSTHVWTAYRRSVGRGEGSSGLRFDRTIEPSNEN